MYDYSGLRTRVNPVTGEVEYDDTPEPVAQPVSEPKAAPALEPRFYSGPSAAEASPALKPPSPTPSLPLAAQPGAAPDEDIRIANNAAQPFMERTGRAGPSSLVQLAPKIEPQIPEPQQQGNHALYTDPHEQAVFDTPAEHKRNLFSKILAGLAGAYYGSQGRIDLAQQIGQQPHLQWEGDVAKRENEINTKRKLEQDVQDRELRQRVANAQITADEARTNELLHPRLDPKVSIDERGGTEYDPNTHTFKFTPNPNYKREPHYQLVPNAQGGYDRIDPDTGERAPVEGSSRPAPRVPMTEQGFRAEAHRRGMVEGSPAWNKAWAAAGFKPVKPPDTGEGRPESSWYQSHRAEVDAAAQAAAESDGATWAELSPLQRSVYIEKTARAMGQDALAPRPK